MFIQANLGAARAAAKRCAKKLGPDIAMQQLNPYLKPMSPQLSLAALASALALVALCFQAPAMTAAAGTGASFGAPAAAVVDLGAPGLNLPSLLPR